MSKIVACQSLSIQNLISVSRLTLQSLNTVISIQKFKFTEVEKFKPKRKNMYIYIRARAHTHTQLCILTFTLSPIFYHLHCQLFTLHTNLSFSFCFRLPIISCSASSIHSQVCIEWLPCWAVCHLLKVKCWTRQIRWSSLNGVYISDLEDSLQAHTGSRCEKCHEWRDGDWLGKVCSEKPLSRGDIEAHT